MKILFLTNKPPFPLVDGGCIATFNLVEAFANTGNMVDVLSFSTDKHPGKIENIPSEITKKIDFKFVELDASISAKSAFKNLLLSKLPYNAERFICTQYENALIKKLHSEQYDIVQVEGLYMCPYIPAIRKYSSARIAFRSHNVEAEIWLRSAENEGNVLKRNYLKNLSRRITRFEKSFVNEYDLLVPITERDNQEFSNLGNKKPSLVAPAGYNTEKWTPFKGVANFPHLFHLGALDWMPNQQGILWFLKNVWVKLHIKHPHLKFYVAGRNSPENFHQEIEKYPGAIFIGEVPDAVSFINSEGIMIVPLLSGGGMRVKIIEGMALGKTIITTSIGAEGICATNGENIFIADSKDKFFTDLCILVENEHLCKAVGNSARAFIKEKYDNRKIASTLLKFYEDTL